MSVVFEKRSALQVALARCMHRTNEVSECLQRAKATSKARLFQNYTSYEVNTMFSYTNSQKSRKISRTASSSAFSTSALAVVVTRCELLRFAQQLPSRRDPTRAGGGCGYHYS